MAVTALAALIAWIATSYHLIAELSVAYVRIVMEWCRSWLPRQPIYLSFRQGPLQTMPELETIHGNDYDRHAAERPLSDSAATIDGNHSAVTAKTTKRRIRPHPDTATSPPPLAITARSTTSNSQQQPQLQCRHNGKRPLAQSTVHAGSAYQQSELEPAFLNESDYPEGWMVWHPVLGVVPKTEADQYDRQQELQRGRDGERAKQPQQQQQQQQQQQLSQQQQQQQHASNDRRNDSSGGEGTLPVLRSIAAGG